MTYSKFNILNNFFTRKTFRNCFEKGYDETYDKVIKKYVINDNRYLNFELICEIYNVLKEDYRNEYYYKNTLLNKLLLDEYSLVTTTALTEQRIAKSKADFLLINNKAVVYEIKTELDSFERLGNQINDYYKAFDHVAIVTCKEKISSAQKKIAALEKPIGLYVLENDCVQTIQEPQKYSKDLNMESLFKLLRKYEYEEIILNKYQYLPEEPPVFYYEACKELFLDLQIEEVYTMILEVLKKRNEVIKEEFSKIPYELKFLAYFMNLKFSEYKKINNFLNSQNMIHS